MLEVTLQNTAVTSKRSAVEGPKMDNHRGQKRPVPVAKDGNIVVQIKKKKYTADQELRRALDMCSKYADAIRAIALYDKIVAEKQMKLNQYNSNVLLYLCASGASDALKPSLSTNRERKEGSKIGTSSYGSTTLFMVLGYTNDQQTSPLVSPHDTWCLSALRNTLA